MIETKNYIIDENANLTTIRDPMVLVDGDTYYLTGTQPPYWKGEHTGVHLWSSKDMEHFTYHGIILKRADMPESMWCRDRFWAPELFRTKNGKYILTVNCRNESEKYFHHHGVCVAVSDKPTEGYVIVTPEKPVTLGNDATIFEDDDGAVYLGFTEGGASLALYRFDTEKYTISDRIEVCKKGVEGEWDSIGIEGQCIVKRHGIYFQWYSSWTRGYEAGILTSNSMTGPWKKCEINPILGETDIYYRAGHNHAFRGLDGKDYITFHAETKNPIEPIERFFIREVEYLPDGTVKIINNR